MPTLKRLFSRYLSLFVLAVLPAWAAAGEPLKIGLLPILGPRNLITTYQPLRAHLERELKRPVVLYSATDFRSYHHDAVAGAFDLILTAPHLARLLQIEHDMQPLAVYAANNRAILITAKSRPVGSARDLRGHNLAVFDPLAVTALQTLHWLREQGLEPGRDYRVLFTPSHTSVAHSVLKGESIMGVTAPIGMLQWTADMREGLHVYAELQPFPGLIWIAHPRVAGQSERIKSALLRFAATTEGRRFFATTPYHGLRAVSDDELRSLDVYAREVSRLLRNAP